MKQQETESKRKNLLPTTKGIPIPITFDVRRWNVAHTDDPIFGLNNEEWDYRYMTRFYTKQFNSTRDYLWPIPAAEIDINDLITQNPGW